VNITIGGINLEEAFTDDYRVFDPSMVGTFGFFSPISSQAGIVRTLSYNADLTSARGFISPDAENKKPSEQLAAVELLNPFTAANADFQRIGMTSTQNKHVTPSIKHSRPLVNSGIHKSLAHLIGDDYAYKAKKDGKVKEIDEKNNLIILEYEDGTTGIIDTKTKVVKNVKAGFYIKSEYSHKLKVGKKFKKGEILAYDSGFFQESLDFAGGSSSVEYSTGLLKKIALIADASVYEDSAIGSETLAKELAFEVITDKFVALGPNSNISKIVKIGDDIKTSDSLIVFENSFDEKEVNDVLSRLGDEQGNEILELGRNSISAKTSGKVVDFRIYYNRPIEEFGPSIRKILDKYIKENKARSSMIQSTKTDDIVYIYETEETKYQKVLGNDFDGILFQFFVSHLDECTAGDKVSSQVALKTVLSTVLPDDQRPLSEYNDEPIDLVISPMSVISRMTVDFFYNLYCNKVLVELKKQCSDIWNKV
jgi:DNA-directed RNA polymerase beta subunit